MNRNHTTLPVGHPFMLAGSLPMDNPTVPEYSKSKTGVVATLSSAIAVIGVAHDLVPNAIAQGVLASVGKICTLIRDTVQNQDDFIDVANICYETCLRIRLATAQGTLSQAVENAAENLQKIFQDILNFIETKIGRGRGRKVMEVSLDKTQVIQWKQDIDHSLITFNAELNIMSNIKLDQLVAMFKDLLSKTISLPNEAIREPLPPMPLALFGRDDLVQNAVEALCQGKHVAFIGAGGIGKSSIAKAILYDEAVKSRYEDQRYFISFEDLANMDSITLDVFLDRIARSFGFQSSQTNNEKLITTFLSSRSAALIILDNAESFLDARREAGRIADAIDKFGNLSQSVQLVLTTRNRNLTTNIRWTRIVVPGLDLESAREAFLSICNNIMPSDSVDSILADIDYHPLSINLLANATLQNDWTINDLVENWKIQHTAILDAGKGRSQSLEFSINLSINSPLFKDDINSLNLVQIVAFLPQGIPGKKLKDIFPSAPDIQKTADTLCKMSLAYRNNNFVTMLSPIRLYIIEKHLGSPAPPYKFPFLEKTRAFYLSNLSKSNFVSGERPKGMPPNVDLIENEDINLERLVVHDLSVAQDEVIGLQNCLSFLEYLGSHRVRPTGLGAIILPPSQSPPPEFVIQAARFPLYINAMRPHFGRRHRLSLCKARCLYHLAGISMTTGLRDALDYTKAACHIFLHAGLYDGAPGLLYTAKLQGDIYSLLGMFKQAEEILTNVLSLTKWVPRCLTRGLREQAEMAVSMVMSFRGRFTEASKLIGKTCQRAQRINEEMYVNSLETQGYICLYGNDAVGAQAYFQQAYDIVKKHGEMTMGVQMRFLFSLSEVLYNKSPTESNELLDQAVEIGKMIGGDLGTMPLLMKAGRASDAQQFEVARDSIRLASSALQNFDNINYGIFQYTSARLELLAINYPESKRLFVKAVSVFEAISDVRFKARSLRSLAEIALLEGNQEGAKELFGEVVSTCDFMGIHPQFLYLCFDAYKLDDSKFPGWKSFYEARYPPS